MWLGLRWQNSWRWETVLGTGPSRMCRTLYDSIMALDFILICFKFLVAAESCGFWVISCDSFWPLILDFKRTMGMVLCVEVSFYFFAETSQRSQREGLPGQVRASGTPEKYQTLPYRYRNSRPFTPSSYFFFFFKVGWISGVPLLFFFN